jgi:hypothetical protein
MRLLLLVRARAEPRGGRGRELIVNIEREYVERE